jgi:hypothetical protein
MPSALLQIITSSDPAVRDMSLEAACAPYDLTQLLGECASLDAFRRDAPNLFERVRAITFLYALYRFHLPLRQELKSAGHIPYTGYTHLLERRFDEAIDGFLSPQASQGPSEALASALALAYHQLAFQTLADQVRRSVLAFSGNRWMFRMGHPADHPLRIVPALARRDPETGLYPC